MGTDTDTDSSSAREAPRIHRLRDLGPRDRLFAFALALALLVAPVTSAVRMFGTWTPGGDNALIELRALDVGSARTPLIGQPSTSGLYGERRGNVAHPGPIEFYLLSPAVRLLGGGVGMLLTAALITGTSVLVAVWAVFRQLGRGGGLAAAAALAAVMWTVGAAAMVNPISSSIGGFPLLCSVVLAWCLLCGDFRLLTIGCVMVSFTAQQHLSVLPAVGVVAAVGVVGLAVVLVRSGTLRDPGRRRDVWHHVLLAAVVGLVLWAPVIYQQVTERPGNLQQLIQYSGDHARKDIGYVAAFRQLGHALGLPPLLGRTNITGSDLTNPVSVLTGITALAAVALLAFGAVSWRRREPRLTALVVMTGALAVGGLINGASVPKSIEISRIAFYHWAFSLAFCELLILFVAAGAALRGLLRRWDGGRQSTRRPSFVVSVAALPVALVIVLAPAVGNLLTSRVDNRISPRIPKALIDDIETGIRNHRGAIAHPTLLLSRGEVAFSGVYEAVAARLDTAGIKVVHPANMSGFVDDSRLVDYDTVRSAIVVATGVGGPPAGIPGSVIATGNPAPGFDRRAFGLLLREARSAPKVVLGAALERRLHRLGDKPGSKAERTLYAANERNTRTALLSLVQHPAEVLAQRTLLRMLADTPPVAPALDRRAIERVLRTFPSEQGDKLSATDVSAYLLTREQLLRFEPEPKTGRGSQS